MPPRPEIIFVVETLHRRHQIGARQVRIVHLRKLVAALVGHAEVGQIAVLRQILMELRARVSVSNGHLDRLAIQFLAKAMVRSIDSLVSPGNPTMKSPWDQQSNLCASLVKRRAVSSVAPFLMFFRICASRSRSPRSSKRQPDSFIAFSVS